MRIALLGDIALFGKFGIHANPEVYDYFKEMADYLGQFDYVIGNLETPFSQKKKTYGGKSAHICANPSDIALLPYLHISHVNLANNHIFDFGKEGYKLTKQLLDENGIRYFGIDGKTECISSDTNRIAMHGYCCYSTNPLGMAKHGQNGVNPLNIEDVMKNINQFHKEGYFNIVSIHAGEEHINFPNYNHILMARKLASAGDYLYYGHHPHVLQGVEQINHSLIAYSLGNFCFDDIYTSKSKDPLIRMSENNKQSAILEVEIENNQIVSHAVTGIYMNTHRMELHVNEIADKVKTYSDFLASDRQTYLDTRETLLKNYIASRKKMRDLNWYLKRLNMNSIKMIMNGRHNTKMYNKNIIEQL